MPALANGPVLGERASFVPSKPAYYTAVPVPGLDAVEDTPASVGALRLLPRLVLFATCCLVAMTGLRWYSGRGLGTHLAVPLLNTGDDKEGESLNRPLQVAFDPDFGDVDAPDFVPDAPDMDDAAWELGDEIGRQIGDEMGREIGRQIGDEIGVEIGKEIGEDIGRQIEAEIDAQMDWDFDDDDSFLNRVAPRRSSDNARKVRGFLTNVTRTVATGGRKALGVFGRGKVSSAVGTGSN